MKRILMCIICGLLAFVMVFTDALRAIDNATEDRLYHHAGSLNTKIKIIKIDDKTMNKMGDFSEWNRDVYAKLIETLCVSDEVRPAVIGFDILFSNQKEESKDEQFANACKMHGNVVTGCSYVFSKEVIVDKNGVLKANPMSVSEKVMPYKDLADATKQGFINALMDEDDSVIRSAFLYFDEVDGKRQKSFGSVIYEEYMHSIGKEATYKTDRSGMKFKYSGKPGDYENISLIDVLNGEVPPEAFDDCIVLVGAYAAGMLDAYFVPVDRSHQMYGVEIHANIIQALIAGEDIKDFPRIADALIAAVIAIALVLICEKLSAKKLVVLCLATAFAKLLIGYGLFNAGYSANVLVVPVMAILIGLYYIIEHYYVARTEKKSIERAFSKYVAPQIVEEIANNGKFELKLGGENREIAVLFVDIRGFTPLSESLEPEQVVDVLNGYLKLTTESIFKYGGTLDKFIGDAAMAVYNAPFNTEDYIYKAILTALDIVEGGNRIEKEYLKKYNREIGFGVGIHCGPAVVGNIGCDFRMDYTAIGDTVNTAARLESKAPKGAIYISDKVYEKVKNRINVVEVGNVSLKGKSEGVFVYSVTGVKEE